MDITPAHSLRIIFGYDDEKGVFKSAGYIANRKYEYFALYYDDY